jgi:hypothetical protein
MLADSQSMGELSSNARSSRPPLGYARLPAPEFSQVGRTDAEVDRWQACYRSFNDI